MLTPGGYLFCAWTEAIRQSEIFLNPAGSCTLLLKRANIMLCCAFRYLTTRLERIHIRPEVDLSNPGTYTFIHC